MQNTAGRRYWAFDGGLGLSRLPVGAQPIGPAESLRLLSSVEYGRIVFTLNALPAIRPVNHLIDNNRIIIRTRLSTAASRALLARDRAIVAYEADQVDASTHTVWSVVVTGRAYTLTDPAELHRYEQRLHPWVNHADTVMAIEPDIVTGFRITGAPQ